MKTVILNKKFVNSKNEPLTKRSNCGIPRYSKVQMKRKLKRGKIFQLLKEGKVQPKKVEKPTKTLKKKLYGRKKVETTLQPKLNRFVRSVHSRKPRNTTKSFGLQTRLRSSFTPGTVCIVLAGRYQGKRVVFLKQLESGLCAVTGPFKLNGVPLKNINQRYMIATSFKVDVSGVNVPAEVNDKLFKKIKVKAPKKSEGEFFTENKSKKEETPVTEEFKKLQETVDEPLLKNIAKVEHLDAYLKQSFQLEKGVYPHDLKF
jgi:large subunit ribosomal protein L6e